MIMGFSMRLLISCAYHWVGMVDNLDVVVMNVFLEHINQTKSLSIISRCR